MLLKHEWNYGLDMDDLVTSRHRMLLERERYFGLGMDALVTVCSWNMNAFLVWALMLSSPYAPITQTFFWFGHG